ncbi:ribonuclease R [Tumebacillus sp. BK434]|uniref:ribonuclease R n=1 Tax=Tumebacillus sp. BK434 TaxID=2512169 RepID=UPI0010490D03|nr:ribonuclease R [Tumebacillus sp. BK434]TCP55824.1 ribonuclease R [Tumebacillus sp. BK434]
MLTEERLLELMRGLEYKPMTIRELEDHFGIENADGLEDLIQMLRLMEDTGQVVRTRSDAFGVPEKMNLVVGKLQGKSKGFGFVIPEDSTKWEQDLFVAAGDMHGAMHGDRVIARINKKAAGKRQEGEIIRILERATKTVVGTIVTMTGRYAFVTPDDKRLGQDIFLGEEDFNGAKEGQKVVIEITAYPEGWRNPQGRVLEILGNPDDPGVDILSVIRKFGLPEEFPEEVLEAANDVPDLITERDLAGRRDLRDWVCVTIDGEDAKDLDDAVNVERLENGNYLLGVHIADVSYYVREGEPLDKEAYARGTSVYLVDRVIPMLPHRLSNGICSLNPNVDRLTMSCEMEFSPSMELVRHDIYPSVINTTERMTYSNVRKILTAPEEHPDLMERYASLVPMFQTMEELAMKLRARRMSRGAIDFDFQETKIIVGEDGKVAEIKKRERTIAEMIIEECMLAANETVSEHFYWMNIPFLYRIHEEPDADRLQNFNEFIHNFGYHIKGAGGNNKIHPNALQELLEKVKGSQEERIINTVMLRSLKQAKYSPEPLGHFGLAAKYYSHFTSPIRRYPDLQIHRIIRDVINNGGKLNDERLEKLRAMMDEVGKHTSERERVAVEAERETDDVKKVEYMLDKVGEVFEGIVSGVTSFGMFVELENSIEGMIHISYMIDDYYNFNEKQYCLIGERTGKIYRIGDPVKIKVMGANKTDRTIDFQLLNHVKNNQQRAEIAERKKTRKVKGKTAGAAAGAASSTAGAGKKPAAKKKTGRTPSELAELKQAVGKARRKNKKRKAR